MHQPLFSVAISSSISVAVQRITEAKASEAVRQQCMLRETADVHFKLASFNCLIYQVDDLSRCRLQQRTIADIFMGSRAKLASEVTSWCASHKYRKAGRYISIFQRRVNQLHRLL